MNQMAARYAGNHADAVAGIEITHSAGGPSSQGKPVDFVEMA
ncbi:hypothetical protein [Burkholderia sp. GS2Y]|uniref:Uncharacterized protein n=1 Tax=Burkholderia theae TaxID=3143496 RepID=A0ABU9WHS4_9BURK